MRNRSNTRFERRGEMVERVHASPWRVRFGNGSTRVVNRRFMRSDSQSARGKEQQDHEGESDSWSPDVSLRDVLCEHKLKQGSYRVRSVKI